MIRSNPIIGKDLSPFKINVVLPIRPCFIKIEVYVIGKTHGFCLERFIGRYNLSRKVMNKVNEYLAFRKARKSDPEELRDLKEKFLLKEGHLGIYQSSRIFMCGWNRKEMG